jgi:acetyl-CoA synthetase
MSPSPVRERVYRRAELVRLLAPRSVAVIGASSRKGSFGERVLSNMSAFQGAIYPVTTSGQEKIGAHTAYASIAALPEVPDCAVIVVPRDAVEQCVEACARAGVGGAIVFASGYGETGSAAGRQLEERLAAISRESGLRLIGPNCMGIANYAQQALLSFSPFHAQPELRTAAIGVASQSGALSFSLGEALKVGTCFSHLLSAGNMCDVDVADFVSYLSEDPSCRAIACVFEGMAHPLRMREAAGIAWKANKPLVVYKTATGEQGAAAAMSHTGSLAGSHAAYRAMLEGAGAVLVDRFEDLVETAAFFAKVPAGRVPEGVAVLSPSGGAAIMAADHAEAHGVSLPQPTPAAAAQLKQHIPDFGSSRNPCDVTAQVINAPESLSACAKALMADKPFGTLVLVQAQAYEAAAARIALLGELAVATGKMACNVLVSQWRDGPGAEQAERHPHVALFRSLERCLATIASWRERERRRLQGDCGASVPIAAGAAADVRSALEAVTGPIVVESRAKRMLAAYGVDVSPERLVQSEEEAVAAAQELGFPVALKVESPQLPHKTEAGVVALHRRDAGEVREAYRRILQNAARCGTGVEVAGVLVQKMAAPGLEIMVGGRVDPLFGPLVVVGIGGVMVELLRDTQLALAPVSPAQARRMLQRLKGSALLDGFRGSAPVDRERLAELVCRVSRFLADHAGSIAELDVNPVICSGASLVAVDALVVKARAQEPVA